MASAEAVPTPARYSLAMRMQRGANRTLGWLMKDIIKDLRGRAPFYIHDWKDGWDFRILAPAVYVFLASVVPALAFGVQITESTGGVLTVVQVLTATAATGLIQAVLGGQPLLIVGVSEPIVLLYGYMYSFAENRPGLGPEHFLAWAAWVCLFAGIMVLALAVTNACRYTNRFTRMSGEVFGMLISVLFLQEAIRGMIYEFRPDTTPGANISPEANEFQWRLSNGLWALFLGFGTTLAALKTQQARIWRFGNDHLRNFLADYGVPMCVVFFSCLSYALTGTPEGVPRRLVLPNTWEVKTSWSTAARMGAVPGSYIAAALVPALMISVLFYFDHTVSAQLAQLEEFNLYKPAAYTYDLFLLGWMTIGCGLLGLPPVNGVLPQAPMHTKSLIILKRQYTLGILQQVAKEQQNTEARHMMDVIAQRCEEAGSYMAARVIATSPDLDHLRVAEMVSIDQVEAAIGNVLPQEAHESRITNFIQALLLSACLGVTPGLKKVPSAVLWGYFAYLSLASLPGSEFWERFLQLFVDPTRRGPQWEGAADTPWMEKGVPFRTVVGFTLLQVFWTGAVYGITWIPIAGVVFPLPILLLIPVRQYLLPRVFGRANLAALDPAVYEDEAGNPRAETSRQQRTLIEMQTNGPEARRL